MRRVLASLRTLAAELVALLSQPAAPAPAPERAAYCADCELVVPVVGERCAICANGTLDGRVLSEVERVVMREDRERQRAERARRQFFTDVTEGAMRRYARARVTGRVIDFPCGPAASDQGHDGRGPGPHGTLGGAA